MVASLQKSDNKCTYYSMKKKKTGGQTEACHENNSTGFKLRSKCTEHARRTLIYTFYKSNFPTSLVIGFK